MNERLKPYIGIDIVSPCVRLQEQNLLSKKKDNIETEEENLNLSDEEDKGFDELPDFS